LTALASLTLAWLRILQVRYVHFCTITWNEFRLRAFLKKFQRSGGKIVATKEYLRRRAAGLLKLAQAMKDPDLAASLIGKAADLAADAETIPTPDLGPIPPDVDVPDRVA
jgi:hypothetical protein